MSEQLWTDVDDYIIDRLLPPDIVLETAEQASEARGLPPIAVTPNQGKFLHLVARINGSRRILEIGTLGGYSTIWLARALPQDGHLITLELHPAHAAVASENIAGAGLSDRVEIRVGSALDSLSRLVEENIEPFDFVFIDADKQNNRPYVEWALKMTRPGSIIIVDNVIREGRVIDGKTADTAIEGTRRLYDFLSTTKRLDATAIQTVGSKGYDGFIIALVTEGL